jgi:PilZ domain-containing protein
MGEERRRDDRLSLIIPVKVFGHDPGNVAWEAMGTVTDVSGTGVGFTIRRPLQKGQVLLLLLPLPKRLRRYDSMEPSYRTYGLVRNVVADGESFRVGVRFLGKFPPRTYDKDPSGLYLLPGDRPPPSRRAAAAPASAVTPAAPATQPAPAPAPASQPAPDPEAAPTAAPAAQVDRRRHERLEVFVNLRVRRTDDGPGPREEQTIADNISRGGARVLSTLAVEKGAVVELEEVGGDFRARAEVKNVFVGPDRIPRLGLAFLDVTAPDRLVGTQK